MPSAAKKPLSKKQKSEIWKSFWFHAVAATGSIIITSIAAMIVEAGAGESLSLLIYLLQGVLNFLVWARFVTKIRKYQESTGIPYPSTYYVLAICSFVIIVGPLLLFFSLLIRMSKVPTLADPVKANADKGIKPPVPSAHPGAVENPTPGQSYEPPKTVQLVVSKQQVVASESPKTMIMKPEPDVKPSTAFVIDDEPFYEEVSKELETDSMKPGLWTKALAEADGDKERVESIYIRLRVAQLLAAKEAELKELQRLEDERIRADKEARFQAAKLEAAEQGRKEKEAEAELEKRLEEQRRLQEEKQRAEEKRRKNEEEEEAAKDPAQIRNEAAQRLKKDLESLACYRTRIAPKKTYIFSFRQCTFYVSSEEILFITKDYTDLPTEILVSRKLGDYIEMALGIREPGVTGIIHLKDGTQFRLGLTGKSKKALKEWAAR